MTMIMTTRTILLAATLAAAAGCSIPYTTPEQTISVPYSTFVPSAAAGATLPMLPAFSDQKAPPTSFPVPAEAKKFKLEALALLLKMKNTGALPLRMTLFLDKAGGDVYAKPPIGNPIELGAGSSADATLTLDPALLQADQLQLGYKFGSAGSTTPVTIKDTDKIEVIYKIDVKAKII